MKGTCSKKKDENLKANLTANYVELQLFLNEINEKSIRQKS